MRLLAVIALLSLLAACKPPESAAASATGEATKAGVTVELTIDGEATVGAAPVRVTVERDGAGVTGASVEVIGEMTHAGMVPVVTQASEVEPGLYVSDEFGFNMAGDWIVSAQVSLENGEELRAARALSVEQR
ncbi:MAG TPA: FixH family protein [Trueperaceae bacterium]